MAELFGLQIPLNLPAALKDLDDALQRSLVPNLRAVLDNGGAYYVGRGCMPSLTNPNNLSIVTGVAPSRHGVPGGRAVGRGHSKGP